MHLDIRHDIKFSYDDYISESWVELRMEPQSSVRQVVNLFYLAVGPRAKVFRYIDWSGNAVRHFSIAEFHQEIAVRARAVVETKDVIVPMFMIQEPAISPNPQGATFDYLTFGGPITDSAALRGLFNAVKLSPKMTLGEQVETIGKLVHTKIAYKPNVTTYESTIDEALERCAGVCQDKAQIMIGLLRLAKIPARYVNGYLHVEKPDSEVAESHAWIEFFSEEFGWIGYDPTGCIQPNENHVTVAVGRHYDDVPPNRGIYRGSASEIMTAEVRTSVIPAPEFSTFREEIGEIPLPVYSEIPDRRFGSGPEDQIDQSSQQQQQQQ